MMFIPYKESVMMMFVPYKESAMIFAPYETIGVMMLG